MWYHADIRRISTALWRGYVTEIIEETTGDKDFQVVWNEC